LSHQRLDNKKKYQRTYFKRPEVRRARCKKRAIKIREMIRKVLQDKKKGYTYESGMSGPQLAKKEKRQKAALVQCKHCLKFSHMRKTHKDCGKSIHKENKGKCT
jgi:hypothetical protein